MLTIVMAVYGQPKMLAHQIETILSYPQDILDQLAVRIVDDHGTPPAEIHKEVRDLLDIRLYRVLEDIPWNQMGARNIGMRESTGWCVMLDPDMVIEADMIDKFMRFTACPRGKVFKFGLKHMSGGAKLDYSSPNAWVVHRDDFFEMGGYNEDFRGHKGWSDCLLQEGLKAFFKVRDAEDIWVSFHLPSDGFDDAMVLSLDRSVAYNKVLKVKTGNLIRKMGGWRRYVARGLVPRKFRCKTKRIL